MKKTLIVGYGNTLRGDDGAGVRVAERIAEQHPEIDCLISHQLLPEMAERIARYEMIVFVDAALGINDVVVSEIKPQKSAKPWSSHRCSPQSLVNAASTLVGTPPSRCYLIQIPAFTFDYGDELSLETSHLADKGVEVVNNILHHHSTETPKTG